MATTSISLSPPDFLSVPKPKSCLFLRPNNSYLPLASPTTISSKRTIILQYPIQRSRRKNIQIWRIYAIPDEAALPSEANPLENSQQIVSSSGDDGVNYFISILLFIAFIGLSILTVGVKSMNFSNIIYIAVTDFLQKREKEKFEKEAAAQKKSGGKKKKYVCNSS
ncbi:hypothetical protein FEM48_Zijuj02G0071000 [Ziziphus jujuba var. spinosa]|uniref:Uncharacterized protein n=1 Tax=Ziziphus jujuba var. spinosa TaxID=714518 RepID=A0A978VUC0_ZIZJJ|nr:hypothetical protein FEM48_Zijuj02G0071000 [Ziziphus jujuba var. spinosa]